MIDNRRVPRTSDSPVAIYILRDQENAVRYVGKSFNPYHRFTVHRKAKGWPSTYEVVEWVSQSEWPARELHWIAEYRKQGSLLVPCKLDSYMKHDEKYHHLFPEINVDPLAHPERYFNPAVLTGDRRLLNR